VRCLVGIDDTDSSRGLCTTYLAFRIAVDLSPDIEVIPYPRLVRLNPNIPFKTRGNAAVCLQIDTSDPRRAFDLLSSKVSEISDVGGGANSGMVFLEDPRKVTTFEPLYQAALSGLVHPDRVRRLLRENLVKALELGKGMGIVGAAASLAFDERFDHTYELIAYRRNRSWGTKRAVDPISVEAMDRRTFPRTYNNYDYQKRKALVYPHGPDPVFAGIRGDSPSTVLEAFQMLPKGESIDGHMVYLSNQHTDAHLQSRLEWKVFSSGWFDGTVTQIETGRGGHVYATVKAAGKLRRVAAYEPTGDLRRAAKLLRRSDKVRVFGGVRRASSLHPEVLNLEKLEVKSSPGEGRSLKQGTYISSPRANRHLTKPLVRYGHENYAADQVIDGWLESSPRTLPVPA
jgi:tRNA(Ile2)-agmatinylcytidine synthase